MQARVDSLEAAVERLQNEKTAVVAERAALQGQVAMLTQMLHARDDQLARAAKEAAPITTPAGLIF